MKARLAIAVFTLLLAAPAVAGDWKDSYKQVKLGVTSAENEKDRMARVEPLRKYLEQELGVPVEIFTAGSYDGVIQALASGQIEVASLGSAAYAAAYTESNGNVVPLVTTQEQDGSTGYYSVVVVRCDSGYKSLADLKGKVLAFADPDSTSGYMVPYFNMVQQGFDPKTTFKDIPFSGSHEAGVIGVVNKQFDAAATYINNETNGIPQRMLSKGMIKAGEACWIWQSPEITNGPVTARADLPKDLMAALKAAYLAMPTKAPDVFKTVMGGPTATQKAYIEVDHPRYQWIIDMRAWQKKQRRAG
ncbi:phosphonate ABC transporter substrate-binding protein [Chelatococcus asaccharovorans]|nr:phosphonate ABC transporter substrate-binding protein [Chelatococcus asaccharovorans]